MANENENVKKEVDETSKKPVEESTKKDSGVDKFIELARQAKENSVSKEEYNKVLEDNEKLQQYILEGKELEKKIETPKKTIAELTKELKREGITNLEYISTSLELRKRYLEEEGRDIFAPNSDDAQQVHKSVETLEGWVKQADGNPAVFNALLEQNVVDDPAILAGLAKMRKRN